MTIRFGEYMNELSTLIETLKRYIILSALDIQNIKNTISNRFMHLSELDRANLLSKAIHLHFDKHLNGVDDANKSLIKIQLIESTLARHQYTITKNDVFEAIYSLDLEPTLKLNLADSWLRESTQITVNRDALETYFLSEFAFSTALSEAIEPPLFQTSTSENDSKDITYDNTYWNLPVEPLTYEHQDAHYYAKLNTFFARHFLKLATGLLILIILSFTSRVYHSFYPKTSPSSDLIQTDFVDRHYLEAYPFEQVFGHTNLNIPVIDNTPDRHYDYTYFDKITHFYYAPFDYFAVKNYILNTRNGAIGSPEQFNLIIQKAYANDIDPLLLFAIIGQEQAFVPKDSSSMNQMINNPFNVFHSWQEFNTTLEDSTQIAIHTIENRLSYKPLEASPFK